MTIFWKYVIDFVRMFALQRAALTAFIYLFIFIYILFIYFSAVKISMLTHAINFFSLMALSIFYFTVILFYYFILFEKFHLSEHRNS